MDGTLQPFSSWDKNEQPLAGGHLSAQLTRFARLWRVHVFLSKDEWGKMTAAMHDLLRRAVLELLLGIQEFPHEVPGFELAVLAAHVPGSPYFGKNLLDQKVAARREKATLYPSGAQSLATFFSL
jgi:hypothetical protein